MASTTAEGEGKARVGLIGLAVMGQNLALNIADNGFSISVWNRSPAKVDTTVARAAQEATKGRLSGFHDLPEFIASLSTPRAVIILVKAGKPVDELIATLYDHLEPGDLIIDGGNEWFENTERRALDAERRGILYMGMGVSGGEEGARRGPSLMPGGPLAGFLRVEDILKRIAAQVGDTPCVTYIGPRGAGNYVKMVHNGIEYGDMQLIAEAYDVLKSVVGMTNEELGAVFSEWNQGELESYLIDITAQIFHKRDDRDGGSEPRGFLIDKVLDKTGMKGTGKWTVQESCERAVACPTISAALEARFLSGIKEERADAEKILKGPTSRSAVMTADEKSSLVHDVRQALYASKICSYSQGMKLIQVMGESEKWGLKLGKIAEIWKGGCIIRARFLDRIKAAYERNPELASLLLDPDFAQEINERQASWRRVIQLAVQKGIAVPALSGSLAYYDSYRRARLPANLTQAQRDFFGAHTFQRTDGAVDGAFVHARWESADEIIASKM